jgi:hypothetical protein
MKNLNFRINKKSCAIAAGLIAAGSLSVNAQTVLYHDPLSAVGNLGNATELSQITGVDGVGSASATPQSGGSGEVITSSGLNFTLGGGATTSEMRFGITGVTATGAAPSLFDWSAGTGGADILAAGGFTVSFNWTAGDTTSGNWIFLTLGNGGDISYSNLRVLNSTTENGILFKNSGSEQIFNSGSGAGGGSYTPTSTSHVVDVTYDLTSWAPGSTVAMSATVDGNAVGSTTFTLNGTSGQFLDVGTYGNANNDISNFNVSTVPEPGTFTLLGSGFALLAGLRRFRS